MRQPVQRALHLITPALFAFLLLFAVAEDAAGQGKLRSANLVAWTAEEAGRFIVRIHYVIAPNGESAVPLAALRFGDARLGPLTATIAGAPATVRPVAAATEVHRAVATIDLPSETRTSDSLEVDITYDVLALDSLERRVRIPVYAVLWAPAAARPGAVHVRLELPAGMVAFDAFPSALAGTGAATNVNLFAAELHVLPAMIAFTAGERAPWIGVVRGVELVVLAGVLLASLVGWRRFRAEMR